MTTKFIKIIEFYQAKDYETNYDRNPYAEYICECCGRKLNPKTMKHLQLIESGHWTNEEEEIQPTKGGYRSQGFFFVGPKCYKDIMKKMEESGETIEVNI